MNTKNCRTKPLKLRIINEYGLTQFEELFCCQYVANKFNGTQAILALYPGLSENSAAQKASKFIRNEKILARIDMLIIGAMKKVNIDVEQIVSEMAKGATANIKDYYYWSDDGEFRIKPSEAMSREAAAPIKGVKSITRIIPQKDGKPIIERRLELILVSKEKCWELLCRYFGVLDRDKGGADTNSLLERMQRAEDRLKKAQGK